VNHINQDGVDIDIFLALVQQGNTLILQDANVSGNYQTWLVNGTPVHNATDWTFPISLVTSGGATNFANNHQIILALLTTGPGASTWSQYPATQAVNVNTQALNNTASVSLVSGTNTAVLTTGLGGILYVNGLAIVPGGAVSWSLSPAISNVNIFGFEITNARYLRLTTLSSLEAALACARDSEDETILVVNGKSYNPKTWSQYRARGSVIMGSYPVKWDGSTAFNSNLLYMEDGLLRYGAVDAEIKPALRQLNGTFGDVSLVAGSAAVTVTPSLPNAIEIDVPTLGLPTDTTTTTAWGTANTAVTNAATAQGAADTAQGTANTALTDATAAQGVANTALANAATAQGTADGATAAATAAQGTADTALAAAAAAQGTADAAVAAAAAAQLTANSALTAAGVADAAAVAAAATAGTALAQSGVTSVNSGTGAISVASGTNINVSTSGSTITVNTTSDLSANTITAAIGYVLDGAGTFTINGSSGGEGNVIAISAGYPEWVNPRPIAPITFAPSTPLNANQFTQVPEAGGYYPAITQDITASSYDIIFDVGALPTGTTVFYVKNLDPLGNNMTVGWSAGSTVTPAVFFGGAPGLYEPAITNGSYCACVWNGTSLTVY